MRQITTTMVCLSAILVVSSFSSCSFCKSGPGTLGTINWGEYDYPSIVARLIQPTWRDSAEAVQETKRLLGLICPDMEFPLQRLVERRGFSWLTGPEQIYFYELLFIVEDYNGYVENKEDRLSPMVAVLEFLRRFGYYFRQKRITVCSGCSRFLDVTIPTMIGADVFCPLCGKVFKVPRIENEDYRNKSIWNEFQRKRQAIRKKGISKEKESEVISAVKKFLEGWRAYDKASASEKGKYSTFVLKVKVEDLDLVDYCVFWKYSDRFSPKEIDVMRQTLAVKWWHNLPMRSPLPGTSDPIPSIGSYTDSVENKLTFETEKDRKVYVNALGYRYEQFEQALASKDYELLVGLADAILLVYERVADYTHAYKTVVRVIHELEAAGQEIPLRIRNKEREILEYYPPVMADPYVKERE